MDFDTGVRTAAQNIAHHAVHVDVGEYRSLDRTLSNSTGYREPIAKDILGSNSTPGIDVEVSEYFDVTFGYAATAECTPKLTSGYTVKTLFEINVQRVQSLGKCSA